MHRISWLLEFDKYNCLDGSIEPVSPDLSSVVISANTNQMQANECTNTSHNTETLGRLRTSVESVSLSEFTISCDPRYNMNSMQANKLFTRIDPKCGADLNPAQMNKLVPHTDIKYETEGSDDVEPQMEVRSHRQVT